MRAALILGWVLLCVAAGEALGAEEGRCQVQVILFVPADVMPPKAYQGRIDQIVDYTESFLEREIKRWGHEKLVMPFRRAGDGHVEVMMLRGKEKASQYKPVPVRAEVMDALRMQNKLDGPRQIWWIMVYVGEPPAKFAGFLGGFGERIGGWSVCNFDTTPGRIDPAALLGSDFLEKLMLKGMIHELGHAFGLPHIGPLERDRAGNTLMGPTHFNYRRVKGDGEDRVYLSGAEAAIFSMHPAFGGARDDRKELPKVQVQDMKYAADARKKRIVVSGRVAGSGRAVYALVADESDARPGEYWTKTYVGKVGADGVFEVIISEPSESDGTLKVWFVFEGGVQTGDGRVRGREGGIPKVYSYRGQQWTFK
ncbi:MAG TPA: hypothetical protein VGQ99_03195 [Tepidisphaeraceae bacterium]|nr:hypothetical protein [Tepidisphaeraceae bacterium]